MKRSIYTSKEDLQINRLYSICLALAIFLSACASPAPTATGERAPNSASEISVSEPEQAPESQAAESSESSAGSQADESSAQLTSVADQSPEASGASGGSDPVTGDLLKQNPFAISVDTNFQMFGYDPPALNYYLLGNRFVDSNEPGGTGALSDTPPLAAVVEVINSLPVLPETTLGAGATIDAGMMILREENNYAKTIYNLYLGDTLDVNGKAYALTAEQYAALKKVITASRADAHNFAQWLVYMNPNRVVKTEVTDENGALLEVHPSNADWAADRLRYLSVGNGKTYTPGTVDFSTDLHVVYTFDNGIKYNIVFVGNSMFIESTDMSVGCEYQVNGNVAAIVQSMREMLEEIPVPADTGNAGTGKPVIYLYPERTQDVSVGLRFNGDVTYTFPAYNGGWNITASPDGSMVNKADGSRHYYLFWEGNPRFDDWDFSTGFVVKGSEVEAFLMDKLPQLGLTPREYNDFITYWVPKMMGNEYNLIKFATSEYEAIAQLTVSPKPDTLLIVHMVYKAIPEPITVREQILPAAPQRIGFTVVEWGGTHAR